MSTALPSFVSQQVFLRCLRARYASVAKSAPPFLSWSLMLAAITATTAITSLHTATAHRSRTSLSNSSSNNSHRSNSNKSNNSNTLTKKRSWPMGHQAPPLRRGPATLMVQDKQTVRSTSAIGAAVIEFLIMLHPEQKVKAMCARRNSSAACVHVLSLRPLSSMFTLWGMWGWNPTSANTAVRPSAILATSGCTSRFTQVNKGQWE